MSFTGNLQTQTGVDGMEYNAEQRDAIRAMCSGEDKDIFYSILTLIGDKWSLMVMGTLGKKPARYTELLDAVPGISRRMLSVTLKQLERNGLVERKVHASSSPWVEYCVTDLGRTLRDPAYAVAMWALNNKDQIVLSRAAFDSQTPALKAVG